MKRLKGCDAMRRDISQTLPERFTVVTGDNTKAPSGGTDRAMVSRNLPAAF
jgi:hypothetical protein